MPKKIRADQLAHEQGLAESRERAKRLIMARQVFVADSGPEPQFIDKPGQQLAPDTRLAVKGAERFVSRGAYKLLTAIEAFGIDFSGAVVLDAGASTGGFTDCSLQHGAAKVYAVDVGYGQLHEKVADDPRVVNMERTNLKDAPPELIGEAVDLVVADVSFISLTRILPACMQWLKTDGSVAALIKPQFELSRVEVGRGVVRDERLRQKAIDRVTTFCEAELCLTVRGVVPSSILGPKGNQEYIVYMVRG